MLHLLTLALLTVSPSYAETPDFLLEEVLGPIGDDKLFEAADVAVQVVDIDSGEEVWARNPDQMLNPASTTKILTAATALRTLGPSYAFRTIVYADDDVGRDGAVDVLYVKGGGDPMLVVEKLWKIARDLELSGVKSVGKIVLDESFFGDDHELPGWGKKRDIARGPSYFPALSALSLNFNTIALTVLPGAVGKNATVGLETEVGDYIKVVSAVKTGRAGSRRSLKVDREVLADGTMKFSVSGYVPANAPLRKLYRTVDNPTLYAGHALRELLEERGIEVGDALETGLTPKTAEYLTEVRSPPLTTVLMDMNKWSSNFMAEQVLRTIGAERGGEGTTAAGLVEVRAFLDSLGVPKEHHSLYNGSGLARQGKLSPAALNAVLVAMARDPKVGSEFKTSLAIAGVDGTLRRRLPKAPNRMRGKTGTLDGVHGLTGYIEAADGHLYAFAFLANGFEGGSVRVKKLHDAFAARMLEVSRDATADESDPGSK